MTTVGLLLAAGHSRRFGPDDKLTAPYMGAPLVCHAAQALQGCALDHVVAVVRRPAVAELLPGYQITTITQKDQPQSATLIAGIRRAIELDATRVLVALGDMPNVTTTHLIRVLNRAKTFGQSCSGDGRNRKPPACFTSSQFGSLLGVSGDRGAGQLLKAMSDEQVETADPRLLKDIDHPTDLA